MLKNHWNSCDKQYTPVVEMVVFDMYVKILKNIAGVSLIGIGVIGIFLPIVQGVLLIIAGLYLMGVKIDDVKKWFKSLKF